MTDCLCFLRHQVPFLKDTHMFPDPTLLQILTRLLVKVTTTYFMMHLKIFPLNFLSNLPADVKLCPRSDAVNSHGEN